MKPNNEVLLRRGHKRRGGQALIFVTLSITVFFGLMSLVVDFGVMYRDQRLLANSTQAAVLAGAEAMSLAGATLATTTAAVTAYSGVAGNQNADANLPGVSLISGYGPKLYCSAAMKTSGIVCSGAGGNNAIVVEQHVTVPLTFARLFGFNSLILEATATAAMRGAQAVPYNVVLILDSTSSMNDSQSSVDCNNTKLSCALAGIQVLLQNLSPCLTTQTTCGTATQVTGPPAYGYVTPSVDRVSLLTFPPVTTATAGNDFDCSGTTNPTVVPYSAVTPTPFPTTDTYQIVSFSSDYRTSDSATTLNSSSDLVMAAGGKSGCTGLVAKGGEGTYYAQVVAAAQAYLIAEQALNPNSKNVLILLSDGDASSTCNTISSGVCTAGPMIGASTTVKTGLYPPASTLQQCHQAIAAAQAAWAAGTIVYAVNFGAEASGCTTDTSPTIDPCQTMLQMATHPIGGTSNTYFSDDPSTGTDPACVAAARPTSSLNQIFQVIAGDLTFSRLIPNGTP
jgi:hypothetical protein